MEIIQIIDKYLKYNFSILFLIISDTELIKFNVVWKLEKYFQFDLHT